MHCLFTRKPNLQLSSFGMQIEGRLRITKASHRIRSYVFIVERGELDWRDFVSLH